MVEVYLSEKEMCERYRITQRTAQRWRTIGGGPRFVRMGLRRIAYRLSDCEEYAAGRTFSSRAAEMAAETAAA